MHEMHITSSQKITYLYFNFINTASIFIAKTNTILFFQDRVQGGPKVGLQLFHYLFQVLDLIHPNHNSKPVFHIPYSHLGNVIQLFPPISVSIFMVVFYFLCRAVCHSVLERFEECCNVEGGHFEHLRD